MKLNLFYTLILTFFASTSSGQVCENEGVSITFYTESINSGTNTINLTDDFGLDDMGRICTPGIATSDDPETYSNSINMTQLSSNKLWQAMAHYHLYKCREAAINVLFAGNFPFGSKEVVTFGVDEVGDAELMFSEQTLDLQLRNGPSIGEDDNPLGKDAFAIANSYFQIMHFN